MNRNKACCLGLFFVLLLPAVVLAGPIPELLPSDIGPSLLPPQIPPKFPPQLVLPPVQPQPRLPAAADSTHQREQNEQAARPSAEGTEVA